MSRRSRKRQPELALIDRDMREPATLPALLRGPDAKQTVTIRMSDGFGIVVPMKYISELHAKLGRFK